MPAWKDRHRAQAGTTLVELLVSLMIVGLALVLVVGTFSTGLLDATIAKRNTTAQAVMQYELDRIRSSPFNSPTSYSECFATENPASPFQVLNFGDPCPSSTYSLRADVAGSVVTPSSELWTVTVTTWPDALPVGSPLSTYKVNR